MNERDDRDDEGIENDRVVQYVDDGMAQVERAAFERELAASPALQEEVRSARILRSLVVGLPRPKAALPSIEALFERLDAEPQPALGTLLRGLRRVPAPVGLRERVFRAIPALTRVRLGRMPARTWLRLAAAAAILVASFVALDGAGPTRPAKGPYSFALDRDAQIPTPGFDATAAARHMRESTAAVKHPGSRR